MEFCGCTNYVMLCNYARSVSLDRRSLEAYLMGVVRKFSERLTPKRSKKQDVDLNEHYFSSKFHGYDVKRTMAYTYHACKSNCRMGA